MKSHQVAITRYESPFVVAQDFVKILTKMGCLVKVLKDEDDYLSLDIKIPEASDLPEPSSPSDIFGPLGFPSQTD